ncbi:ATP-binding protein [Streptomyces sp. S465]|uniref:ATP-binding protein n=1 Tax=Streptomyces sp. S465 TaxID=2979468 RepID=UPI0022A847AE|nr:ATP-binding protein [Streptomyces sp. S465]WAP60915.1 ATP-binding protein [Streptomyces sp. S465]
MSSRAQGRRPTAPATYPVRTEEDLLTVRHAVRAATVEVGFGLVDQTRVVTAASELARNAYVHGGGGTVTLEYPCESSGRRGLRLIVKDEGPGIADLDAALTDGFTTGTGLGHGLGGARRLMDEFTVRTGPGEGTVVVATRWTVR